MQGAARSDRITGYVSDRPAGDWPDASNRTGRGRGLVVELVGPPGAGKTTLARGAAAALRRRGVAATLGLSARPAELQRSWLPGARIVAGAGKLASLLATPVDEPVTAALLRLMPLKGRLSSLRRRRYLAELAARRADMLLLEDQGYICAIAGLAVDSGRVDEVTLAGALDAAPLPDLVVRLEVPDEIAAARLRQRLSQQGPAERMLERPPAANAHLVEAFDLIGTLLARRGNAPLHVSGRDLIGLEAAVGTIVAAVLERRSVQGSG